MAQMEMNVGRKEARHGRREERKGHRQEKKGMREIAHGNVAKGMMDLQMGHQRVQNGKIE